MTPPLWQKVKKTKVPLDESESEKASLKPNIKKKNEGHGIWSYHFMANRCRNSGNSGTAYFPGL